MRTTLRLGSRDVLAFIRSRVGKGVLAIFLVVILAPTARGQTVVGTITREGLSPTAVAVNESANKVYVADGNSGNLYTYDGQTLEELNSAAVGTMVYCIVVDEAKGKVYTASRENQKIGVVDASTGAFIKFLSRSYIFFNNAHPLVLDAGLGRIYANSWDGFVQVNTETDIETVLPNGGGLVAVNPVTHEIFATNFGVGVDEMTYLNPYTYAQTTIPGLGAYGICVNWTDNKAYTAYPLGIFNRNTSAKTELDVNENDATDCFFNPASDKIYTDSEVDGLSTIFDGVADTHFNLPMSPATTAVGFRHSTHHVYYASLHLIAIYDEITQTVETIPINNPTPSSVNTQGVAVNQATGRVYVINDSDALNFVTVIQDTDTLTRPPVYAEGSSKIFVIDPATDTATDELRGAMSIGGLSIAVRPGGGRIYTPNEWRGSKLHIFAGINQSSGIASIDTGGTNPAFAAVTPNGSRIYVTNDASANVGVIDASTYEVLTTIPVGETPYGIAVSPAAARAYVANHTGNSVTVINTTANTVVTTIPVGSGPYDLVINPNGTRLYVTNSGAGTVSVINTATNLVTGTVTVGTSPQYLAMAPDGRHVYVVNSDSGNVSVIDTGTDTVVGTIPAGTDPQGIAILPDGTKAYVAHYTFAENSALSIINLSNFSVTSLNLPNLSSGVIPVAVADPTSKFAGRVTKGGVPFAGALVRAMQGTVQKGTAVSNAAGDYSVFNLKYGVYTLEASAPGCAAHTVSNYGVNPGRTTLWNPDFTAGDCTNPALQLSASDVAFGNQVISTPSATQSVTLTNAGYAALHVSSFTIEGAHAADFSRTHNCGGDIAPGGGCSVTLTFTPSAAGPRKSILTLPSNAPGSPNYVLLTGVGTALRATPVSLNFGSRTVGSPSPPSAVTLTNLGGSAMRVWSSAIAGTHSGDFSRTSSCPVPPATLAGGGSCTMSVTFTPGAAGARSAALLVSHDAGGGPLAVPLNGAGVLAAAPGVATRQSGPSGLSVIVSAPTGPAGRQGDSSSTSALGGAGANAMSVRFGRQAIGAAATMRHVVLTNTDPDALLLEKIELAGVSREDFAIRSDCGSSLAAGESCKLRVMFTPRRAGPRSAVVNVAVRGRSEPQQIRLEGTGSRPRRDSRK